MSSVLDHATRMTDLEIRNDLDCLLAAAPEHEHRAIKAYRRARIEAPGWAPGKPGANNHRNIVSGRSGHWSDVRDVREAVAGGCPVGPRCVRRRLPEGEKSGCSSPAKCDCARRNRRSGRRGVFQETAAWATLHARP